jgi:hypothetical protein
MVLSESDLYAVGAAIIQESPYMVVCAEKGPMNVDLVNVYRPCFTD